ncbi:MAG TPA: cupin domain-containing protein [Bacillota bacterium]|nr:cupin domain-containing protein [Bacillota bacterium]
MRKINPSKFKWKDSGNGYSRKIFMATKNKKNKKCKVQFVRIPPNTLVKAHFHKGQTESEYVISGSGSVKSGKQIIQLRPGTLFIVGPNEFHEVKSGSKGLLLFVTKANYSDDTEWFE